MKILILGAHGQIARVATRLLLDRTDADLTLYLRDARRLAKLTDNPRVTLIEGDVLDAEVLDHAVAGRDVVYANLAGDMERQARAIVTAMDKAGVRRLIFISSMGIYDEVPGERHGSVLDPYRNSAKVVEVSDLDYTIIRPAWLDDQDEIAYGTTRKGDSFVNFKRSSTWVGAGHGGPHLELRQCPIQQRLPGKSLTQHCPVPAEVVAEIPGCHTAAAPVHQPLDLAVVCVHSPEPEATLLPPLGWDRSDLHRHRRDGRHHHPTMLGTHFHRRLHIGRRAIGADHRPGGDPAVERHLDCCQRRQDGFVDPTRIVQSGQHRHLFA
jgi:hypothetical protein